MATLNPYLSFNGDAREALQHYHSVLGGTIELSTFGEFSGSGMPVDPSEHNLVMHGAVITDDGLTLMGADAGGGMPYVAPTAGVTVALTGGPDDHERLTAAFEKLSEGGTVDMPLEKAPWGDYYGAFTDRFGISWMVDIGDA